MLFRCVAAASDICTLCYLYDFDLLIVYVLCILYLVIAGTNFAYG